MVQRTEWEVIDCGHAGGDQPKVKEDDVLWVELRCSSAFSPREEACLIGPVWVWLVREDQQLPSGHILQGGAAAVAVLWSSVSFLTKGKNMQESTKVQWCHIIVLARVSFCELTCSWIPAQKHRKTPAQKVCSVQCGSNCTHQHLQIIVGVNGKKEQLLFFPLDFSIPVYFIFYLKCIIGMIKIAFYINFQNDGQFVITWIFFLHYNRFCLI